MSEKVRNIPKLRFPEFRDAPEWKRVELNKLGNLVSGLTYSPDDVRESGLLVLRSSNVQNGEIKLEDNVYVRTDIKGANLSEPNDILICVRNGSKALIGKNALIPNNMPLCTHGAFMTIFRAKLPRFVFQLFQTSDYERQVNADLGATINSINGKEFLKYEFYVPSENEQQKIADCLSSIDELITSQAAKVEALKEHKKALMQQLFPREGETVPSLRFPEFQNAPEWEDKALDKVCEINPSVKNLPKSFIYIDLESVEAGVLLQKKIIDLENAPSRAQRLLKNGDVIFQMVRPYQKNNYLFDIEDDQNYVASTGYAQLRAYQSNTYLFHCLHTDGFVNQVLTKCTGSNYPAINSNDLSEIKISIPKSEEQQKIADCLSSIDELITSQAAKVEALKEHKKALMQQLFPKNMER